MNPTAAWRLPVPGEAKLAAEDPFILGFRDGGWIQERTPEATGMSYGRSHPSVRGWPFRCHIAARWWASSCLIARPHSVTLDWEAFDLLRAAGRQAASYLAEERSTKVLRDAEMLTEYSKRFAFVVHDIKNLASQLSLVVSNAKRYIDDPEFQRDMLQTVEDAVARMNHLLSQLKADAAPRTPRLLNPSVVVDAVAAEFAGGR